MGRRLRADDIHLAVSRQANTLSWPVKKKRVMKGQHVELASKKKIIITGQHFELASEIYESKQPMCDHRLQVFLKNSYEFQVNRQY